MDNKLIEAIKELAKNKKMTIQNMGWDDPTYYGDRIKVTDIESGKTVNVYGKVDYPYFRWGDDYTSSLEDEWAERGTEKELKKLSNKVLIEEESLYYDEEPEITASYTGEALIQKNTKLKQPQPAKSDNETFEKIKDDLIKNYSELVTKIKATITNPNKPIAKGSEFTGKDIINMFKDTLERFKETKNVYELDRALRGEMDELYSFKNIASDYFKQFPDIDEKHTNIVRKAQEDLNEYKEFINYDAEQEAIKEMNKIVDIEAAQFNYIRENLSTLKATSLYNEFIDEVGEEEPEDPDEALKWMDENEPYSDEEFVNFVYNKYGFNSQKEIEEVVKEQQAKEQSNNQQITNGGRPRP